MVKIIVDSLSRKFRDGTKIGPISYTVENGELFTLLGPSGSGKTTTLKMLAGFFSPDKGRILFNGQDVTNQRPEERSIGIVVQSVALFPNMDVFQNISFGLDVANCPREKTIARVEELASMLSISNLLHKMPSEVSGGEAQRVALARAIAKQPDLLLLDEPFSALDPQLRNHLQFELRRIQQELGLTTIYVTHNQSEAFAISDTIAVLNQGTVVQVASPRELYESPNSRFTAEFIGSGNIIEGVIERTDKEQCFVQLNGSNLAISTVLEEGQHVALAIKPEDIHFDTNGEIEAQIVKRILGVGEYRFILQIGDNQIKITKQDYQIPEDILLRETQTVRLRIDPKDIIILQ